MSKNSLSFVIRVCSKKEKTIYKSKNLHKIGFECKTRENSNFMKNGKMIISVKIRKFSRSRMTNWTSPLESSCEI